MVLKRGLSFPLINSSKRDSAMMKRVPSKMANRVRKILKPTNNCKTVMNNNADIIRIHRLLERITGLIFSL